MSHRDDILDAFRRNGGTMTLGYILSHPWGYEFRARATELRRDGYVIAFERGRTASENKYHLIQKDSDGQLRFVA